MIYKSYDSYDKTKIPWLPKIPTGWRLKRVKFSTYVKGRVGWHGLNSSEFMTDGEFYLVTGTEFNNGSIDWEKCYRISKERYEQDPYIHLENGDLLITKDGTIGKLAIVMDKPNYATLNSGVFVTRNNDNEYISKFMYYVLSSSLFEEFIYYNKTGTTINHLYQETFINFKYCYPDLTTQTNIIAFLDSKISQIEYLIAKKKELIEKLFEKRYSLITNAVTKGLDENVKIKDSDIEWIGQIPKHWDVIQLKRKFKIVNGSTPKSSQSEYWDGNIVWITPTDFQNVRNGKLFSSERKISEEGLNSCGATLVPANSLVLTTRAPIGKIAIAAVPLCTNQGCKSMVLEYPDFDAQFIYWCLLISEKQLNALGLGTTFMELGNDSLGYYHLPLPPLKEQLEIILFLMKQTKRIDDMIEITHKSISQLEEYRMSLITSAVTGKIDVRDWKSEEQVS